jgi:hypothetical protein
VIAEKVLISIALPHSPMQDDYYNGYIIPKGIKVIPNTWFVLLITGLTDRLKAPVTRAILNDPATYTDPETFNPSRYLTSDGELDPQIPDPTFGFGSGRRLCPVSIPLPFRWYI